MVQEALGAGAVRAALVPPVLSQAQEAQAVQDAQAVQEAA